MTIILSERDLPVERSLEVRPLGANRQNNFELKIQSPHSQSWGYKRSLNFSHGLNLLIRDYWLQEDLVEENLPEPAGRALELGFNIRVGHEEGAQSHPDDSSSFLELALNRSAIETKEWCLKGRVLKVDLHVVSPQDSQVFSDEQLALIPADLHEIIDRHQHSWYQSLGTISPAIQMVLLQILNCPYTGSIQQVYLEGKALELIALQTAQWLQAAPPSSRHRLKPADVERTYHARDIITQRLDEPPSLLELARSVGLNDCTLKRGFRQVFGTTVFGYLRQQRRVKARQLLQETEMSVAEVTCQVGYTHSGHFAAAFKREFGVTPKVFKNSVL